MNFEVPLVTDMTPVDPPPGAAGGAPGSKRFWHGNDDEHPEVSSLQRGAIHPLCRNVLLWLSLKLLVPGWALGSYSSGPPAGGTPQILIF